MNKKFKLGLLGENIEYTLSPYVHDAIFSRFGIDGEYSVIDVKSDEFDGRIAEIMDTTDGFNVTKPYKRRIIPYLNEVRCDCHAVNTVCGGKGYNTDGFGFAMSFDELTASQIESVLLIGAGGAAREIYGELKKTGLSVFVWNRTEKNAVSFCEETGAMLWKGEKTDAVINASVCGLSSNDNLLDGVRENLVQYPRYAFDLIYSPAETAFLKEMRSKGANTRNGLDMLVYQAIKSDEIILGIKPAADDYLKILETVKTELRRIGKA